MVAGTPEDWVRWLTETYAPAGLNHALISFTDPFTLRAWAGIDIEGLPIWESRSGSSASRSSPRSTRSEHARERAPVRPTGARRVASLR